MYIYLLSSDPQVISQAQALQEEEGKRADTLLRSLQEDKKLFEDRVVAEADLRISEAQVRDRT
jgi:hypothetical protein